MQEALILAEVVEVQDGNEAEREVLAVVAVPIRVGLVGEKVGEGENQRLPYSWEPSACQGKPCAAQRKSFQATNSKVGGWPAAGPATPRRRPNWPRRHATRASTLPRGGMACSTGVYLAEDYLGEDYPQPPE